jgi:hypothetical protein
MGIESSSLPLPVAKRGWLRGLASLWLTAALIACVLAAVAWSFHFDSPATWSLAAPLGGLLVNLAAAVAANPVFRRQTALLVFHLALMAVVLLIAIGRLTYMKGNMELTTGAEYAGTLVRHEAGPLHPWHLERAAFTSEGFEIDYAKGLRRAETRNPVRWIDADGRAQRTVIGDQTALVLNGYRFYTSPNKGYTARVAWMPSDGAVLHGVLNFPAYPVFQYGQTLDWTPEGSAIPLKLHLQLPEGLLPFDRATQFSLPREHSLRIEGAGEPAMLRPGDRIAVGGGMLVYEGLTTWMGYSVHYDRTLPWLVAAAFLACGALGWHFWHKFAARPWRPE